MTAPTTSISSFRDLLALAEGMKKLAKKQLVTSPPQYSATPAEATANALKNAEFNLNDGLTRLLLFLPDRLPIVVALTIDAYDELPQRWHLSVSRPNPTTHQPERAGDSVVDTLKKSFFPAAEVVEGPPEGAYSTVRHFRSAYLPN